MVLVDNKTIEFRVIETAWNYSVVSCRPPGSSDTIGTLFGFNLPDGAEPLCFADVNMVLGPIIAVLLCADPDSPLARSQCHGCSLGLNVAASL